MTAVYQVSNKVSIELRAALGQLCVDFSILEWSVERSIWALKGQDRKSGRITTSNYLTKQKINALKASALDQFGAKSKGNKIYNDIGDALTKIAKSRNLVVHGLWAKSIRKGELKKSFVLTYFKKPNGVGAIVTKAGVNNLVKAIREADANLHLASQTFLGAPLP